MASCFWSGLLWIGQKQSWVALWIAHQDRRCGEQKAKGGETLPERSWRDGGMPNSSLRIADRSLAVASSFTAGEVLAVCRRFVYPPCGKLSCHIKLGDHLDTELGYVAAYRTLLALKTNETFQMDAPDIFSGLDLSTLETVQDHVQAVCRKLADAGRLVVKDSRYAFTVLPADSAVE